METKKFPNGFDSWKETYFEVVSVISIELINGPKSDLIKDQYEWSGIGAMYELAEKLTDEFENLNKGREWDGEFMDEIFDFMNTKLYQLQE